jgi:two-component system chemotaxis response regulator CheB
MPVGFTRPLAESLTRQAGRKVLEATDGMFVEPETVYLAVGAKHLLLGGTSFKSILRLTDQPPENGCRPAADVLFRSAAAIYGAPVIGIILTGMGKDGTAGLAAIRRAGGYVIAQDEASSAVWGMPRSAVEAGVTDIVLPLEHIPRGVAEYIKRCKAT